MKTKTLVSLGLLTCIGFAGFSGAQSVLAAESTGTVTLTDDWKGTVIDPETEGPNTVNPEGEENPDPAGDADLALVFWPDFAFGAHNYDAQKGVKADAAPIELERHVPGEEGGETYISPLFVQVRSSVAEWKLSANLTQQFTGKTGEGAEEKTSTLKGSTITLGNNTVQKNTPTDLGKAATAGAASLELGESSGTATVGTLKAAPTDEVSINSFLFGTLKDDEGEDSKEYTGVELDIPKGLKVLDTSYEAVVTWTLSADAE